MALPLEGIRVVDLTHVYAGPTCTRILSDLGADVVKVEAPQRIDITRNLIYTDNDPGTEPWNRTCYYNVRNAGKRSITLDLGSEKGHALLTQLIAHADVLAESFSPRVMANFGLDFESVRKVKPDIIMLSMSGYGQTGPYRDWGAYGMGLEPASGVSQLTGYRGGPPLRTGISFTDPLSGILAAGAVLAALHHRRRTGKGQFIDLSEQEAAIPLVGAALMDYLMNGRLPERMGNRSPYAAPQGCYPCRGEDEWLVISVTSDEEWAAFCRAAGHPEWAADERFADILARYENHDALDETIGGWTRTQDKYEAFHLLQRAGVKAAPVLNGRDMLCDPHFKARGHFDVVDSPIVGRRPVHRHLVAKFDCLEAKARGPAPRLGEHNREVLGGLLGLSDEELAALEEEKVIGTRPEAPVPFELIAAALKLPMDRLIEVGAILRVEPDYKKRLGIE